MKTPLAYFLVCVLCATAADAVQVTNTGDAGAGSLRQAISDTPAGGTVTFAAGLSGGTIALATGEFFIDKNLTIDGSALPAGITIDANGATTNHRVLKLTSNAIVLLDTLTLTGGRTPDGGGPNSDGGGIFVTDGASLTLTDSTISGNTTGAGGNGGGIYSDSSVDLTINQCTISGNTTGDGGPGASGSGGGIYNAGGNLILDQSTVSGNATGDGGSAAGSGGGIHDEGDLVLHNTVIAGNRTGIDGLATAGAGPDLWKDFGGLFFTGSGINFIGDLSDSGLSASATLLTGDPLLAPLGDFGGSTLTMLPLPGSPLIDPPGADESSPLFSDDQRGSARMFNGAVDIGAVEHSIEFFYLWSSDFDRDGRAYGLEYALGTDPNVFDAAHPANLTAPTVTSGLASLTFGYNCMASPRTNWVLTRSTDLTPGSFVEIYRFDGPNLMEVLQPNIDSTVTANSITVMDNDPPAGRAFYRLEALLTTPFLVQFDAMYFSDGLVDAVWMLVSEGWLDSDDYSFQISITGNNDGFHLHGEDTIQMSDTVLLAADAGQALVSVPWTTDPNLTHSPESYTASVKVYYKGEYTGYENSGTFGPY